MTTLMGLDLTGRAVLVAGGGPVAARRVQALLADGAAVTVVAPDVCETLRDLALAGEVVLHRREVESGDLDGAWLVHTATGDSVTDVAVVAWAEERRIFCIDAGSRGRPAAGSARTPATTRTGDLVLGVVSTGAADPRRSVAARDALAAHLREGAVDLRRRRDPRPGHGHVTLVGGGPGELGLMTVEGRRALAQADVVVTDRLGPVGVLDELPASVQVIDVGKVPGHHRFTQAQIGDLLVEHARLGRAVVRLKGGDPFVYGRGGEEVLACRAAGVPVTVVPGVSSAFAAPLAAGIPLTHRGVVGSVLVMNGQDGFSGAALTGLRESTCTVVVLMGVGVLGDLATTALAAGVRADLPVAVVENGTLPNQRVTHATLATVTAAAAERRVKAPAVIVLGDVADPGLLVPASGRGVAAATMGS
ncbi:uroporphyrinogen-III C-methyltransferase [Serinibacter arcticus]|uniref:uroporphyrinogen-III C-methyltransferase n=1 Tax=Serinibacter arcticus TaxID=1655435 RepID=A0A4Z1E2Q5_9MICO|nr:uroporphyrinogen-III C-methyltransferase [Serinibacter arcticus]TGO05278.1 Siroheme synthase / Precorrin-2 oxidase [Serinibacter arcticus]